MEYTPLKYIYQASGIPDARTLLLLHGTGGDERDLLSLATHFGKELNVLSLRGNVQEHGMPRFFKRLGPGIFDENDLRYRTAEMVDFLEKLSSREHFELEKIIALGYSNGANIISSSLVLFPGFFAGAIMYRPMKPFKTMESFSVERAIPLFASNGTQDATIDEADTRQLKENLANAGYDVTAQLLEAGHALTREDVENSVLWFQKNFS